MAVSNMKKKAAQGTVVKKTIVKVPYPKDSNMSPADSASFRAGAGGPREGDGYAGISSNPYFQKGKDALKNAIKPKKTMKSGGKMMKKAEQGAAVSNKFTIPAKPKAAMSNTFSVPPAKRQTTRSYTGTTQAEGDSMLNAFKKRNPGMKSGGKLKKK